MVPIEYLCADENDNYSNKAVFSWEKNDVQNCSFTKRVLNAQSRNATELIIVNTNDQLVCSCIFVLQNHLAHCHVKD